jgi:hypothetical protein
MKKEKTYNEQYLHALWYVTVLWFLWFSVYIHTTTTRRRSIPELDMQD